jgi:coniferyl-aldehyde dehydrogenase
MGHYHGYEGFATFSKLRPVFKQGSWRALDLFVPPYAGWPNRLLNFMIRLKS